MQHDRHRVFEDLRGELAGEVDCSDVARALYASDAGIFQIVPLGVVKPKNVDDVVQLTAYAREHQIPLHARGGGTSHAGQTLGPGLVVDFSRYMNRIVGESANSVTVQAGMSIGLINTRLAKSGRCLGFDASQTRASTAGGSLGINRTGVRRVSFDSVGASLRSAEVVTADGETLELSRHQLEPNVGQGGSGQRQRLIRQVSRIIVHQIELVRAASSSGRLSQTGYQLNEVLHPDAISLGRLLAGSEGSLALCTQLELSTYEMPSASGFLPIYFDRLEDAAAAAAVVCERHVISCTLLDRRYLGIVRELDPRYEVEIPSVAEAMLLVQSHGETHAQVVDELRQVADSLENSRANRNLRECTTNPSDVDFYRRLMENAPHWLDRIDGARRPIHFADQVIVEAPRLGDLIATVQRIARKHEITMVIMSQAALGRLQLRPLLNLSQAVDRAKLPDFGDELAAAVWQHGAAVGRDCAFAQFLPARHSPQDQAVADVWREIKHAFDAEGVLNVDVASLVRTRPLEDVVRYGGPPREIQSSNGRPVSSKDGEVAPNPQDAFSPDGPSRENASPMVSLALEWHGQPMLAEATKCSGCGVCRAETGMRMCPLFHATADEAASPRAKANLLRVLGHSANGTDALASEEAKAVTDFCYYCHMCRIECPAGVDIPTLVLEAKARQYRDRGLRISEWCLAHVDELSRFASRVHHLANWGLASPAVRWVMERLTGISRKRKIPPLARRSLLTEAKRKRWIIPSQGKIKVAYFADTFANYYDHEIPTALEAILQHHGAGLWVPADQSHSAMAMISKGAIDAARVVARKNVDHLAEAVRQGYRIIATEPSAVLALTHEYPKLLPNDGDVQAVAENTIDACHYLWRLHLQQRLRLDFHRVDATVGYHAPCHLLALQIGTPGEWLMKLVPGLSVQRIEQGCSGMAGTYGLQQVNYRSSLRMGLKLMNDIRTLPLTAGATECSTCKMQMEHATSRSTLHPIKILAIAYGLMPQLRGYLR